MAEERLIDEDKDRKYKIRKNADGEDELVIDAEADVEEEFEEVEFEVTESDFDDEEAAVMTPEQLAAREKAREEAEAKRVEELNSHISRAQSLVDEENLRTRLSFWTRRRSLTAATARCMRLNLSRLPRVLPSLATAMMQPRRRRGY